MCVRGLHEVCTRYIRGLDEVLYVGMNEVVYEGLNEVMFILSLSVGVNSLVQERWGVPVRNAGGSHTRNYPSLDRAQVPVVGALMLWACATLLRLASPPRLPAFAVGPVASGAGLPRDALGILSDGGLEVDVPGGNPSPGAPDPAESPLARCAPGNTGGAAAPHARRAAVGLARTDHGRRLLGVFPTRRRKARPARR